MTAPASPRVSEELVEKCARLICFHDKRYCGVPKCVGECAAPWENHVHMKRDKAAAAIITLAQDAKLREALRRFGQHKWDCHLELNKGHRGRKGQPKPPCTCGLRAMMVKP